ncbi:hypothetical protein BG011_005823 [Mortierella polycephala]|uniref:TUG ubiquitin-like domain-containing protein n=1 Tax=Mortierella polycephala TaxID=41804 RepID=A0A9P6PV30_9FUNG|nr:hypothetical protein BG011_005823 [Mortierella polycephala]
MATQITIILGGGKKQLIKATPVMTLRDVVNTVCERQRFSGPENYGLRNGKSILDLSLSIRQSNVTSGMKLELVRIVRSHPAAPGLVNITLQLEDGKRMQQTFASTTTLWDVLRGIEMAANGRTGTPPATIKNMFALQRRLSRSKSITQVYMLPTIIMLEREYTSIRSLKVTTLEQAGLTSGNAALRVVMRYKSSGIEKYIEEIERDYSQPKAVTSTSSTFKQPMLSSPPPPQQSAETQVPGMTGRTGAIQSNSRDGNQVGPGAGGGSGSAGGAGGPGAAGGAGGAGGDNQRQTPTQDISSAMVEATQEIRQLREQQTQEALTDRVKRLSKSSEGSSDKDRFVRCMMPELTLDTPPCTNIESDISHPPRRYSPTSLAQIPLSQQEELVWQIARRVNQQLKEAQMRGDSNLNYHSLIAQEIVREQKAGVLPNSPTVSRKNSAHALDAEDQARLLKVTS